MPLIGFSNSSRVCKREEGQGAGRYRTRVPIILSVVVQEPENPSMNSLHIDAPQRYRGLSVMPTILSFE